MKIKIFRLQFNTPVHFGIGNLDDSDIVFKSDRLFSALLIEAFKKYGDSGMKELLENVKSNKVIFSDAMPYYENEYYAPKPYISIKSDKKTDVNKKQIKKMKYIPISRLQEFVNGDFTEAEEVNRSIKLLGNKNYATRAVISRESGITTPYQITSFSFNRNAGLYIVFQYENENIIDKCEELLKEVGYAGIGGKKSSGYGKFNVICVDSNDEVISAYEKLVNSDSTSKMTISTCLPKDDEIENALKDASYVVVRNGGFVDSTYENIKSVKKKNIYYLTSGSCFANTFEGDVYNVSFDEDNPIYRYAKPFFINVGK